MNVKLYANGTAGSYVTGTASYTPSLTAYTRTDNAIKITNQGSNPQRGYAVFDLSGIPSWAIVSGVVLGIDINTYSSNTYGTCKTYGRPGSLATVTNANTLYNNCGDSTSGTLLWSAPVISSSGSYGSGIANYILVSSPAADAFVQGNIGSQVSICFTGGGTNAYTLTGETGTPAINGHHAPYLQIYYSGVPSTCGVIMKDSICYPIDSICDPRFYLLVSCSSPTLFVKTYYGDGMTDTIPFTPAAGTSYVAPIHHYNAPGHYTVKQVVYYNNVATDSVTFTYHHSYCQLVHIKFYSDENDDCTWNNNEHYNTVPVSIEVDSAGIPIARLSATSGIYYHEKGAPGTLYTFRLLSGIMNATCPSGGILYDIVQSTAIPYSPQYFGLICMAGSDIEIIADIIGTGRHQQNVTVYARNNRCFDVNSTVTAYFSPKYHFSFAKPSAVPVANTITWNDTIPILGQKLFKYQLSIAPDLMVGDSVHSDFLITPIVGDAVPANNDDGSVDTVKSSYDPNNITVGPAGCFWGDTTLHYAIHFENTGNDTAQNIYVMDTLSGGVDINSLKIVAASAEMDAYIINADGYNIIKFDFPNIKLLDSSHHGLCDGSVLYTVNNATSIPYGAVITNRAGIYFDDNEAVMTNMTENTKGCHPISVPDAGRVVHTALYPNPATGELTISTDPTEYRTYTITNNVGQLLMQQPLNGAVTRVNVNTLPPGLYYVTLKGDNGSKTMKFVKM